jgi:uncharacterized protein YjbI with pentapeptide repeats
VIGGALAAALIIAATIFLPRYLVERDCTGDPKCLSGTNRAEATNDRRATLLQAIAGAVLAAGAAATWRTVQVTREGQITERFTRAIDQLGSKSLDVRLGGIYALERIAKDSSADRGPVMEVLTAYVRENAAYLRGLDTSNGSDASPDTSSEDDASQNAPPEIPWRLATDVQAILTIIARRDPRADPPRFAINLRGADLERANLQWAYLGDANLFGANLVDATLVGTVLEGAHLEDADLRGADLMGAILWNADLTGARLEGARLRGGRIADAHLVDTSLRNASLKDADLRGADLRGASADVTTTWPEGFNARRAGVEGL